MKKMLFSALFVSMATVGLLVACKKSNDTSKSTTTCTDSAYLFPDSFLMCSAAASNYKLFTITATNKNILVAKGTFTDIDTIVNGAAFIISYDSIGTVPLCGAIMTKANLTCHTKL